MRASFVLRVALLAIVLATAIGTVATDGGAGAATGDVSRLTGGATSMDSLVEQFLHALETGDGDALQALRVSKEEYLTLVIPGHVKPGEPPQVLSPEAAEYFWGVLNTKSYYFQKVLLHRYEGRKLEVVSVGFEKGVGEYAGHRAHKQIALALRDAGGKAIELRTGSVIERDGRFKFESFIRD